MSNTNEYIAQISALSINYEKLNAIKSSSTYTIDKLGDAVRSITELLTYENEQKLKTLKSDENKEVIKK